MLIKKLIKKSVLTLGIVSVTAGITYAAFSDVGKYTGSKFSVGNADLKLFLDVAGGIQDTNLVDELPGPIFDNITPNWTRDYPIKLYNNGSSEVALASEANYLTANDPEDLRNDLNIEIIGWTDSNTNGLVESGELGTPSVKKTFVKWKTEGFSLGNLASGEIKGLVLRFSVGTISDTKQGSTGLFDFHFDSTGL